MRYDVVIIPETFHRLGKHNIEHLCVPIVIEDRSYDIAMEILNGLDSILRDRFMVSAEDLEGDDCDILYRKYTLEKGGKKAIVHVRMRGAEENCPPIRGNVHRVFEFERDVEEVISEIEGCLS